MKNSIFALLSLVLFGSLIVACDDNLTYAQQLEEEKQSISDFIALKGITVGDTVPSTLPWPANYYYLTQSGMYLRVEKIGTVLYDTIPYNTEICVRFREYNMDGEYEYGNMYSSDDPFTINYNNVSSNTTYGDCVAWHEALKYVGDGGEVSAIIPASIGFPYYTQSSSLVARFYELKYVFWK